MFPITRVSLQNFVQGAQAETNHNFNTSNTNVEQSTLIVLFNWL